MEERGLVYRVAATEPSFLRQRLARVLVCRQQRGSWTAAATADHTFIRLNQIFLCPEPASLEENRASWLEQYRTYISPGKREELAARRRTIERLAPRNGGA